MLNVVNNYCILENAKRVSIVLLPGKMVCDVMNILINLISKCVHILQFRVVHNKYI